MARHQRLAATSTHRSRGNSKCSHKHPLGFLISVLQNARASSPGTVCSLLTKAVSIVKGVAATALPSDKAARIIADMTRIKSVLGCS